MPDPARQTISASEAPALFNASRYTTRWMLYHEFIGDAPSEDKSDARMTWGTRLEPLILEQAADDLKLLVTRNMKPDGKQEYIRNGLFGCHRDGEILCPDRGPGAIETKAVFDYQVWMREWDGGKAPPREYETQLQTQMKVGKDGQPYKWGVIAAWLAGQQYYFERKPIDELWEVLDVEGEKFMASIKAKEEPDPFGVTIEAPILTKLFPVIKGSVLDLREDADAIEITEQMRMLDYHSKSRLGHERAEKDLKAFIMGKMFGTEKALLPGGVVVELSQVNRKGYVVKPSSYQTVSVYVPADLVGGGLEPFEKADLGG